MESIILGAIATCVLAYLAWALLNPEKL